jgi:hypothetical protein
LCQTGGVGRRTERASARAVPIRQRRAATKVSLELGLGLAAVLIGLASLLFTIWGGRHFTQRPRPDVRITELEPTGGANG